jgi:flagellar FliL protein
MAAGASKQAEEGGGGRRRLVLIAGAALVLAAGAGGGFVLWRGRASGPATPQKKAVSFVDMKDMTVNLSGGSSERPQFLRLKIALEVEDAAAAAEVQRLLPRVEDSFQTYLRELRASDIEGSAGMYRLKEELTRRINLALHPARIEAVLFKDVLVQ